MMRNGKDITFGLIVGTRGCFNFKLAANGKKDLVRVVEQLGYGSVILPDDATPTGCVEGRVDGVKCAKLFADNRDKIDGIIISLPNFGDELGVINAIVGAALNVPILIHAADDYLDKLGTDQRRDSFCGKLSVANNLYQHGIPYSDTTYHSCDVNSQQFSNDVKRFAAVCRVYGGLRKARIGAIGARPTDFQTMRISEKLLQKSGITVVTADLSEIIGAAGRLDNGAKDVKECCDFLRSYGNICQGVKPEEMAKVARFTVALENWIKAQDVVAAGIQCWTSIQQNYGCAACAAMSMIGNRLVPCACETDVGGAISMYALTLAGGRASALLDWNNNYGDERGKCVCTHCGNYPANFTFGENANEKPEISYLDVLSTTLGKENCFGAVKGKVKAGDMTYFRISTDDRLGKIKAYLGEGRFTDDRFDLSGGVAVCEVPELQKLMKHIVKNGYEHHVGMSRGHLGDIVQEAVENYLGWDVYRHEA